MLSTIAPPRPGAEPKEESIASAGHRRIGWLWPTVIVVIVAGVVVFSVVRSRSAAPSVAGRRQMMALSVGTAPATRGTLNVYLTALGSVTPLNTVTVKSRATGELRAIHFTEGQLVKAGDLLAEIDPRAYQVALEQSEGQLARDQASLDAARRDLARYQNAEAAVTQQQIDAAKSSVAQYEGAVRADQGAVENSRLQLSYCQITAPLSGRAGLKLVDQGNLIQTADTTGIVVIAQEQPISVVFSVPEDSLPQLHKALGREPALETQAFDRAMKQQLASGTLTAVDNQIDSATGTVKLRATFPNADGALFPNQFVNIRLLLDTENDVTLVPTSAIQIGAQTRSVFVVRADGTVERRTVKTGQAEGERTAILDGVKAGEVVATDSLDRLQDGAKVNVRTHQANQPSSGSPDTKHRRRQAAPGSALAS
jgi:multidrug efflux system membrane fusion protein